MAEETKSGVKVRPHPAAGAVVVVNAEKEGEEDTVIRRGTTIPKALFEKLQKKENHHRPILRYPDGYPVVVEDKEEE